MALRRGGGGEGAAEAQRAQVTRGSASVFAPLRGNIVAPELSVWGNQGGGGGQSKPT